MGEVTPGDKSETVEQPHPHPDRVSALVALYGAERADNQNSLAQSLVLVSMLIAYSVGVGAIIATSPKILTRDEGMPFLTLFLPLPVWAAVGFHVIVNALVFAHNRSIEAIENELRLVAGVPGWVGGLAGQLVSDANLLGQDKQQNEQQNEDAKDRKPLLYATAMAYGGAILIVAAFTISSSLLPLWQGVAIWICIPTLAVYCALAFITYKAWHVIFDIDPSNLNAWAERRPG